MHSLQYLVISVLFLQASLYSQVFVYEKTIGSFNRANTFSYTPSGYFYVMDLGDYSLIKIDTSGNESVRCGGFGWDDGLFDEPVDLFATPLLVYVTDYNNHRIQQFDAQLNFISKLSGSSESNTGSFRYPVSCTVSASGDLFILEYYSKKILKYNFSGNYLLEFGGIESGEFSLTDPKALAFDANTSTILVLEENSITFFDTFGNGIKKIRLNKTGYRNFSLFNEDIIISDGKKITIYSSRTKEFIQGRFEGKEPEYINDLAVHGNQLFILEDNHINVYQIRYEDDSH